MRIISIIPAYNEEKFIKKVVECCGKHSDVVVVDDGSNDQTSAMAESAGAVVLKHSKNLGKGAAIKTGLKYLLKNSYDAVILIDGDGQHDPSYIPQFVSILDDAKIVMGSRFKEKFPENMPIQRKLSNKITTRIIRYVTGYQITDSQSGYRLISSDIINLFVDIKYNDYVFESEMLYKASKMGIKIKEISIPCDYGTEKSYVTLKNALNYVIFIIIHLLMKLKGRIYH
ncbi:MAG: glycosyltransferase family 2 protein [Methanomicrobiales archaeon]